jgi:hypothetical protein
LCWAIFSAAFLLRELNPTFRKTPPTKRLLTSDINKRRAAKCQKAPAARVIVKSKSQKKTMTNPGSIQLGTKKSK